MTIPSYAEALAIARKINVSGIMGREGLADFGIKFMREALAATQERPARFDGEKALAEFEAKPGKCARCGFSREDHSYNGACYGLCGKFVEAEK